ncbi:gametogenetin-binding protein 1-like isoform X2 [Tenrec ecaudatus]|uniref:gametogenetin-binding protein 1-like isoform X2 n=1 Tax=Tenrec ecaudatus TaxID=94439 RepID=UPI003F59CBD4
MEAPAPRHRSRILGRSSMFRFFRSLVGGKSSPQCSAKGGACPSPEPATVSPVMGCQPGEEGKEPRAPSTLPCSPPMATSKGSLRLLQHGQECLGMGDVWAQNLAPTMILWAEAQGQEVEPGLARGHPSEKEEEEEAAAVRQASRNTGASIRGHLAQALEVQPEPLQKAEGPLEVSRKALAKESQDDDLKQASFKAGVTLWNHLLSLYKQLQKPALAKLPLKEGLALEEKGEEEEAEEEDSLFNFCVPGIVPLQSPLHKTFRSTDTVGFVESELKTLLAVQRESRLWKMGAQEGRELLAQPEITLEEAGIVDGQHLLLEEKDAMGNWPPE